jgi:hypothetical protein
LDPAQTVYIDGILFSSPPVSIDDTTLVEGETATITVTDQENLAGKKTTIRIVTLEGAFTEKSITVSEKGQIIHIITASVSESDGSINPSGPVS